MRRLFLLLLFIFILSSPLYARSKLTGAKNKGLYSKPTVLATRIYVYEDPETGEKFFSNIKMVENSRLYMVVATRNPFLEDPKNSAKDTSFSPNLLTKFDELFNEIARTYNLDPKLLHAIAKVESNYNPRAVSPKGALGVMQLIPSTARLVGVSDPFDPRENIHGGARYLRYLLDKFGDLTLALAAYNAGPKAVEAYGGIPPYEETQRYVRSVLSLYQRLRGLE
jgi:Soluble lytic murein transglycosylase and related regulatory proteins (some contain LysM/invasin domains)